MDLDLDEVDLAILDLFDLADEAGVSPSQTRIMLRERIEIAFDILEALAAWDWPEPVSTALH